MKEHIEIEELLAVYRDLSDEECRQVDRHVRVCATCTDRLMAYQAMDWDLAGLVDLQPDEQLREVFYNAVGADSRQSQWFSGVRRPLLQVPALAGQAVAVGVLLLLMAGLWLTLHERVQPGVGAVTFASLSTWLSGSEPVPFETWSQGQPLPGEPASSEPLDPRPFLEIVNDEYSLTALLHDLGSHPAYWPQTPIDWENELLLGIFQPLPAGYHITITHITRQGDTLRITTEVQPGETALRGASMVPYSRLAYHLVTIPRQALPDDRFRVVVTDSAGRPYESYKDAWFDLNTSASTTFLTAPPGIPTPAASTPTPAKVSLWLGQTIQIGRSRYRLTRLYSVATTEPDGVPGFQIMYEPANEAARRQPTLPARRIAVYDPSGASFRCAVARVMLNRKQELAYGYLNCAGEFQDVSSLTLELQSDEGDVVRIPLASPSTEAIVHEVAPGDTVVGIARQYNLTLDELIALNGWPESGPTKLIVGQAVVVEMGRPPQLVRVLPAPGTVQPGGKVRVCGTWDVAAGNLKGAARLSLDGRPLGGPGYVTEMRPTQEGPSLRREACWEVDLPVGPHTTTLRYTLANGDDFAYRWNFSVESNE